LYDDTFYLQIQQAFVSTKKKEKRNELLPFHRKKEMKVLAKKRKEMKERPLKKEK